MTIIRVIDLETNGLAPPAEVIERASCDLVSDADGEWTVGMPTAELFGITAPMDPQARAVHHIRPEEISGLPPYIPNANIARGADALAAHNWDFEAQWLAPEVLGATRVICTYKAALRVWPDAPSHSNGALRYWLEDQGLILPSWSLTQPPHRADPDAYVTAWLLRALLATGVTGREMIAWTKEPPLHTKWPVGKHRGAKLADIPRDYFDWVLRDKGMDEALKWNARRELDRRAMEQRA